MGRHANLDIKRSYAEFQDTDSPSKVSFLVRRIPLSSSSSVTYRRTRADFHQCAKVRCLHCGFTRAKNTTRQIEHLQECQAYLNSPEAAAHLAESSSNVDPQAVLNGTQPNPNLQIHRRGPNQNKRRSDGQFVAPVPAASTPVPTPQASMPSLTTHLLGSNQQIFNAATQQPFLSHAGCGTLSAAALQQWMNQDSHYTRAYIQFIGSLVGKLRLPGVPNSQFHPMYRTLDLLISAINNIRREMGFFENTAMKYGIVLTDDAPSFITRAYMDLFQSVSSPGSTLLEGMVVLWSTGHCCRTAWNYAAGFTSTLSGPTTEPHIAALHQSLIPNWTSPAFAKFVDACRSLVDELANIATDLNGKELMQRCDQVFRQICWLEERFWPDVDGMGEEDESSRLQVGLGVNGGQGGDGSPAVAFPGVLNGVEAAAGSTTS